MFAARYFAPRYFAPRYWAEVGHAPGPFVAGPPAAEQVWPALGFPLPGNSPVGGFF